MTCSFYKWKSSLFGGDYYCMKKEDEVNTDIYNKYCRDYNYSNCPIYRGNDSSSSSCYLTTACMVARGRGDNCYELETLRTFRDSFLKKTEDGRKLVEEYYDVAPKIVSGINDSENRSQIYENIYNKVIEPCISLIESGHFDETVDLYRKMVLKLKEEFI